MRLWGVSAITLNKFLQKNNQGKNILRGSHEKQTYATYRKHIENISSFIPGKVFPFTEGEWILEAAIF